MANKMTYAVAIDNALAGNLTDEVVERLHDLQAQLGLPLALGLAHVGAEDDLRAMVDEVLDGGQGGDDALVAGDLAVLQGDVEVAAAQHALAGHIDIADGFLVVIHKFQQS